ncbi:hypothetical protein D3C78_604040 [compost metagenome]
MITYQSLEARHQSDTQLNSDHNATHIGTIEMRWTHSMAVDILHPIDRVSKFK